MSKATTQQCLWAVTMAKFLPFAWTYSLGVQILKGHSYDVCVDIGKIHTQSKPSYSIWGQGSDGFLLTQSSSYLGPQLTAFLMPVLCSEITLPSHDFSGWLTLDDRIDFCTWIELPVHPAWPCLFLFWLTLCVWVCVWTWLIYSSVYLDSIPEVSMGEFLDEYNV